jgi:transcriptional regulator with GAF, ATPase, and Fis domain
MTARNATQAFADAASALTGGSDVTDVLARLVRDSAEVLAAQAVGLLILDGHGGLELLSCTSHRVAELEMFQIQQDSGPCVEAIRTTEAISDEGRDRILARWPQTGPAILGAGYQSVQAYPLRWHGHTLGAMNIFRAEPYVRKEDDQLLGQAFADIAALVIIQSTDLTSAQVSGRLGRVLASRAVIEQAKGVLSYNRKLDLAAAYDLLRDIAAENRSTLSATAANIVAWAQQRIQG